MTTAILASGSFHSISTLPLTYVLVTPARNEAAYIEMTITSVLSQTVKPLRWVIVSDGSTDQTDEIVSRYAAQHPWITLIRTPERRERHFAGKVSAFNVGFNSIKAVPFDIVGSLDADISFTPDYFEFLLKRFAEDPILGVAGTPFVEGEFQYDYRFVSTEHVSGACQLFRRECFDAIGGYTPIRRGVDLVAVVTARMKGWKTRTFVDKTCNHHRKMGTGDHKNVLVTYWSGYYDYLLGVHPVWQVVRAVYEMRRKPYVLGGCVLFAAFFWAMMTRAAKPVSPDFVAFRRSEQIARLRALIRSLLFGLLGPRFLS